MVSGSKENIGYYLKGKFSIFQPGSYLIMFLWLIGSNFQLVFTEKKDLILHFDVEVRDL